MSRKKYTAGSEKAFPVFAGKWESALNPELAAPSRTPRLEVHAKAGDVPLHVDLEGKMKQQHQNIPIRKPS